MRIIARLDIKGPNLIKAINLEGLKVVGNPNDCLKLGNIKKKFESFDIVTEECDGHNFLKIEKLLKEITKNTTPK